MSEEVPASGGGEVVVLLVLTSLPGVLAFTNMSL